MTITITGIAGSLRRGSLNRTLLRAAAQLVPPGAELIIWDELDRVPPFNEDWETDPAPLAVARMRQAIAEADGLLIATPEYNGSIPGQLKNAIDWASRPYGRGVLQGKPAAVISASPSPRGAAGAAGDLRKLLTIVGASIADAGLAVPSSFTQFGPDGLTDPDLTGQLGVVVDSLVQAGRVRRAGRLPAARALA
jgi:chromate reductase, NAD(P)H dehydrogenase (quinone)